MGEIQVVDLRDYILSHEELARQPIRGRGVLGNDVFFEMDARAGVLDRYKGSFVLYHKGVMCGQSNDGEVLFEEAGNYYGKSDLSVFKVPDTWELLSRAGFKYDTTFAYADCVGFRNGMCHPFKPFNLNTNKEIDILEIPLTIMDATIFLHMNIDQKRAWDLTKQLIDTVEQYNGVITILFHNDTYKLEENLKFYEKLLKYCSEKGEGGA